VDRIILFYVEEAIVTSFLTSLRGVFALYINIFIINNINIISRTEVK